MSTYDDNASFLDAWKRDRSALSAQEQSAHERIERAVAWPHGGVSSTPSGFTRCCSRSAELDAASLDGIAAILAALPAPACSGPGCRVTACKNSRAAHRDALDEIRALIRSTGRSA